MHKVSVHPFWKVHHSSRSFSIFVILEFHNEEIFINSRSKVIKNVAFGFDILRIGGANMFLVFGSHL